MGPPQSIQNQRKRKSTLFQKNNAAWQNALKPTLNSLEQKHLKKENIDTIERKGPIYVPPPASEIEIIANPNKKEPKIKLNPYLWKTEAQIEEMKKKEKEDAEKKKKMKFTFKELKNLNDVTKNEYINKILEEDAQISMYLKKVHSKVEQVEDSLVEQKMIIEDIKEDWHEEMEDINKKML